MAKRIDAHHHLWRYSTAEYGWISESMRRLRQDFGPADLKREMDAAGIDGAIVVQAQQTIAETRELLALSEAHNFISAVVGWSPIASEGLPSVLEDLTGHPKLRGLRHVIQDEPDENFILGEAFNRGIRALLPTGLVYEILIYERHLPQTIAFVDRHPNQIFVLDHIGKPRIREGLLSPWRERMRELARRENVYCKVSGMVTEADQQSWTEEELRPYFDTVLEAFSARRLMMGSDWPVCLLGTEYTSWFAMLDAWSSSMSNAERERFSGGTAEEVYGLSAAG
ncbi:amidohydrolase family protein [Paracidobacterium acidisoli]|uniref:Amidohydrolase n=1 Tax=Paracidobacterium acidisoli TaxID=2303751 RepID=A0A372IND0_9BACT|nr:amidohydrolase family protein [Paracidobacterium acidisoli]MBT9331903.1 amidohydrolase family protein [Paracidobacterium acidisoli]